MQLTFETNFGQVFGPYGSNNLKDAYPFASSGSYLKDLHVSEGKVCPTFLVKFLVVVGICPEWSMPPIMERIFAECRSEVGNSKEGIEIIAKYARDCKSVKVENSATSCSE